MPPSTLTRPRLLGIGLAVASLAFASCGHGGGTTPPVTPTGTGTPLATISPTVVTSPCVNAAVAYEPDGGNGNGFTGIQTVRYEDASSNLCASGLPTPMAVNFSSSVGPVGFASNFTDALALLRGPAGGYTLGQDIFGLAFGQITPVGAPYDLSVAPTPAPTAPPTSGATVAPTTAASPTAVPLIADGSSVTIVGSSAAGSSGIALVTGPQAPAIVALTSLNNAPPQYGNALPYSGATYTVNPPSLPRSIVQVSGDGVTLLARGPSDLLAFQGTLVGTGYQYNAVADDTTLGSGTLLRGRGNLAIDPADSSRAVLAGSSGGSGRSVTLVTGLPTKIVAASTVSVPGNVNSVAIDPSGSRAYASTDAGIVVLTGVNSTALSVVAPGFAVNSGSGANVLPYVDCNGRTAALSEVYSLGFSSDQRFLVALGTQPGATCPSGRNASVVAIPFSPAAGVQPSPSPTPSPNPSASTIPTAAPSVFVQNNVIAPPSAADYFLVH